MHVFSVTKLNSEAVNIFLNITDINYLIDELFLIKEQSWVYSQVMSISLDCSIKFIEGGFFLVRNFSAIKISKGFEVLALKGEI